MKKKIVQSVLIRIAGVAVATALVLGAAGHNVRAAEQLPQVTDPAALPAVDPVDLFLSQSAFIGNSVGEGLTMYNNAKNKVPLGNAVMLTRVSYSFYADANGMSKYLPKLNGVPMRAADAVKNSGVSYVFISMGTNDLVGSSTAEGAYAKYQQYLAGIMAANPLVTLFIESCTPSRPGSNVNNDKITAFNSYMQAYCDTVPNMYYVDIATPLKGPDGYLAKSLTSDGSVHLTMGAYAIWADTVRSYITAFLLARTAAQNDAQKEAVEAARLSAQESMKAVDEKKAKLRSERLIAEEKQKSAEEAARKAALLSAPDEMVLMLSLRNTDLRTEDLPDHLPLLPQSLSMKQP